MPVTGPMKCLRIELASEGGRYLDSLEWAQANVCEELCRGRAGQEDQGLVCLGVLLTSQVSIVPAWLAWLRLELRSLFWFPLNASLN